MSAAPARIGATISPTSVGSYWLSAWTITIASAPSISARAYPLFWPAPYPRFAGWRRTSRPWASAVAVVSSSLASSTSRARSATSAGISSTTVAIVRAAR